MGAVEFSLDNAELKEQYPVTAHAPNVDFWTGCREIKDARRVRELRRAWPTSMLHLNFSGLQINNILFPLNFDMGEIEFFGVTFIALGRGPKDEKRFDAD